MPLTADMEKIQALLPEAMLRDRVTLARRLDRILKNSREFREGSDLSRRMDGIKRRIESSIRERRRRLKNLPAVTYPEDLPILSRRGDILEAIEKNQVVIISGDTGSGKSTQIPKMCIEAGRGVSGMIGCTQPRRIAAMTIARRIAHELAEKPGKSVGYKVRFKDITPKGAYIKVLTDGMLLAETQGDPRLLAYDTLILDEAHERNLNIDFMLGILRTLLPRRQDLKVILTSATMDTRKFAEAFEGAPVLQVSGRLFPVDVEYLPLDPDLQDSGDTTYVDQALTAVERLRKKDRHGDILIFMPTEQDILETCERLEGMGLEGTSLLPLFARLPASQQDRVYSVEGSKIVVATNVAETSLTIPGIKFVIDTGLARIAQYLPRTRTNSLPVSPISRSSADQRKGRCGRVQEGVCIRLFSEEDFEARPEFTPPEILRSNLAGVILRMIDLRLGDPAAFPFVDPPKLQNIKDGYTLLEELGAITRRGLRYKLTAMGRFMARMPLDPRISRVMLEAGREGVIEEVGVIASALSIQDPRERPAEKAAQADQMHAPFKDPQSDFVTLLNIWRGYHREWESLKSQNRMRKFCRAHFLSFPRMREWVHTHDQILAILKEQDLLSDEPAPEAKPELGYGRIHRAILSGFLSNIAIRKDRNIYQATRGREVMLFPGSTLFNKNPQWIVAAEMIRTSRLFARTVARIEPEWLETLGGKLCKSSYSDAHWERNRGEVRARERVTLYGLTILSDRSVSYGPINPREAQEIFIRSALVEGDVRPPVPGFLTHNRDLLKRLGTMEDKLRRRDILVSEPALAAFYAERLPGILDIRTLKARIKGQGNDAFLRMEEEDLISALPDRSELDLFPDEFLLGEKRLKTSYRFAPGQSDDGVTVSVPLSLASRLPLEPLEWGVPGLLRDKITALLKGLPKRYRKQLVPVSGTAEIILKEMKGEGGLLLNTLARFVYRRFGVDIPAAIWTSVEIPDHLRTRVALTDPKGHAIREGRDIQGLIQSGARPAQPPDSAAMDPIRDQWERKVEAWDFDTLPDHIPLNSQLTVYPALEVQAEDIRIRIFTDHDAALRAHERGVEHLLVRRLKKDLKYLKRNWTLPGDTLQAATYFGGQVPVEKALYQNILTRLFRKNIRTRKGFEAHVQYLSKEMFLRARELRDLAIDILGAYHEARSTLLALEKANSTNRSFLALCGAIRKELGDLAPRDFLECYDRDRLGHLPRYLRALEIRVQRAANNLEKDRKKSNLAGVYAKALEKLEGTLSPHASSEKQGKLEAFRWLIEEFKVSLYAQELRTPYPVSPKRMEKELRELERMV